MYLSNPCHVTEPVECGAGGSWRQKDRTDRGLIEAARRPGTSASARRADERVVVVAFDRCGVVFVPATIQSVDCYRTPHRFPVTCSAGDSQ